MERTSKSTSTTKAPKAAKGMSSHGTSTDVERGGDVAAIKAKIAEFRERFMAGDIDGILELYADDVIAYDMMPPLSYSGRDEYRKAWEKAGGGGMTAPWVWETKDEHILVGGDIACVHHLVKCGATNADGKIEQGWTRHSMTFQRRDGDWLVVFDHYSVPIDMESGKGLMDLEPDSDVH